MIESLIYFNENGEEAAVNYEPDSTQTHLHGFSRGVKWKQSNKQVSFFEKNIIISAFPCITKPYVILIYNGFISFAKEDNYTRVVDYNGKLVKQINLPDLRSAIADKYKLEGKGCRIRDVRREKTEQGVIATLTVQCVLRNGWLDIYEKCLFDEEKLEAGDLINAWEEP